METRPGDSGLPSNNDAFHPMDCSTLKFSTSSRGSPVTLRTDSVDHNFDTLKSPVAMESPKFRGSYVSPAASMDADIMRSRRKSSNSYLKEYQEKYGKLGIFRDEDLDSAESRTLCFPFFKESFKRVPGRRSFIGSERPGSPGQVTSLAASWDPALMDTRYSSGSSPLSASPVSSTSAFRNMLDGNISKGNLGRSSGRDWHCSVSGSGEMTPNNQYIGEPPGESVDSEVKVSCHPDTSFDETDGSQSEFVKRLAKSNVTLLAQTALRELEASYRRPGRDTEVHSEGHSNPEEHRRDSSPGDLASLASQGRGDVLPERCIESPIPVINISRDYDANDRTVRKGFRSRSSRRAVSDLGFTTSEPGIVPTPRTAALLSNPAFKKHLAKNMGISEEEINEKDFQYDFKLNLPGTSPNSMPNLEADVSPSSKLAAIGLRERLLRTSVSDSSLQPPSCLNMSIGALSNDSSFNSLEKTMSDSYDSILSQPEARDPFTSPNSALNTGFATSQSLSDLNTSTQSDTSPSGGGKVKFHIPSFREFKQQRKLTPRSPGNHEHFKFDFMSNNAIQEENESETSEKLEHPNEDSRQFPEMFDDPHLDSHTIVNALTSDLMQGEGQMQDIPRALPEEPLLVYDPTNDVSVPDVGSIEPPEGFRHGSEHRKSDRRSRRSHKSVSRSKAISSMSESQEDLLTKCHETESQDSRGKHRKEPNRRTKSSSRAEKDSQVQSQGQKDSVLEGHQEVKVIKEFKLRDSSKGHSGDSKIMVVMIKDEAKESPSKTSPKVKDKLTERPPKPERRKRKEETRKDETYIIKESKDVPTEHYERVDHSESPLSRDGSRSRSSKRSSSRSKKDKHHREHSSKDRGEEKVQEFDDKVIGGHPGDGFETRGRSDHLRRSSRRSSRRRFLPKTDAVEEPTTVDTASTTSHKSEEDDNKPSDLPQFPSSKLQHLSVDNPTVTRSVSDISDKKAEEQRKKGLRERRQKLYKSDPFAGGSGPRDPDMGLPHGVPEIKTPLTKKDLVGSRTSREEILTLIQETKTGGATSSSVQSLDSYYDDLSSERHPSATPPRSPQLFRHFPKYSLYPPLSPLWGRKCRSEDGPSGAEVERVDSGVGAELKDSSSSKEFKGGPICEDCEGDLTSDNLSSDSDFLCKKCESRRVERKETIQEIVDTEVSYGKDLKIIKEEFFSPMQTAGLLNEEQLSTVFSNLDELITINDRFSDQLLDGLELANEQGDEDYNTVLIGRLFLEASNMLLAFETYCVNQASVPTLLEKLEEEKELLRIFLHVSQTENSLLRRMNLRSFLMVPVQRVMKYPLLLSRLHKTTAVHHEDRDSIRRAQGRIEDILEHINSQSRGGNNATMRLRRKISGLSVIKKTGSADDIEINKMAIEVLGWNRKDVNFVMSGRLLFTQPTDHLWMKKSRTLKFMPAYALLLTLGRSTGERWTGRLLFSRSSGIQDAALVLIKEKAGKFVPLRDPLKLERCVISVDPDCEEVFEIMDSNKESFLFKGEDKKDTQTWLQHLKLQTKDLGSWRRRRNALPNIMIHSNKS